MFFHVFLQFGLGGAGVRIVETRIFLRGTVMKASSHQKHAKQQWKKHKKKGSDPWARSGERPGTGHGSELVFLVFPWFFAVWPKPRENQKKQKKTDPWARSGLSTHKPKTKKTKNQETKKFKKQKNKKQEKKKRMHTPRGGAQMQSVGSCLFFWFVCG